MEGVLRQSGGSPDIRNKIAGLERQEQVLAQMLGDGYLDPAFYIPEKNRIQAEREEFEAALDASSGGFSMQEYAEKTREIITSLNHSTELMGGRDETLFAEIVEKVIVDSRTEVRFCLANGLCIKEEVEVS